LEKPEPSPGVKLRISKIGQQKKAESTGALGKGGRPEGQGSGYWEDKDKQSTLKVVGRWR